MKTKCRAAEFLHRSCMLNIADRMGWFKTMACAPCSWFFTFHSLSFCSWSLLPVCFRIIIIFIATTVSLKLHSLGLISNFKYPAANCSETRVGCQLPREAAGQRRNSDVRKMKAPRRSAFPSQLFCEWWAPRMKGTVTVKIANAAIIIINHLIRYVLLHWGLFLLTGGIYLWVFLYFYKPTLLIGAAWWACWMGSCHYPWHFKDSLAEEQVAALPDSLFHFNVVVVLFLWVVFPPVFSLCFLENDYLSACSAPQMAASFLVAASVFKGVWQLYLGVFCVPTVREMSGSLICLVGNASHSLKKWKWDPGQRTGLRLHLGPLIRACRIHWVFRCSSPPSITAETAEMFLCHARWFSRECNKWGDSKIVGKSVE